jgi:hypothetical protein
MLSFFAYFREILRYQCHENRPVGAELFHAEREADMTKLTFVLSNFAEAPKNSLL